MEDSFVKAEPAHSNGEEPADREHSTREEELVPPQWTVRRTVAATLVVLGIGFVFYLLYRFYMVVFIFFVAVAVQIALEPVIARLQQYGLQRKWAVGLVYLLLLLVLVGIGWSIVPLLVSQIQSITQDLPDYYQTLRTNLDNAASPLLQLLRESLPAELPTRMPAPAEAAEPLETVAPAWEFIRAESRVLFVIIATFVLAYYWTLDGRWFVRQLSLRIPMVRRDSWREMSTEMESKIGDYLRGQAILCAIIGSVSLVAFLVLRIPNAFVLALFMGIFEAVPIVGPLLGAIPAIFVTLVNAPEKTLWVIISLAAIQLLESNLLVPRVMNESVGVNAIVSMLSIAAFGLLFGIGGAILAVPLAAILQILLNHILFDPATLDEDANELSEKSNNKRNRFSVLRLQAQELTQDIRRQSREETAEMDQEKEQAEDLLESVASDLSKLLSDLERA